jgi:hypothetical protein
MLEAEAQSTSNRDVTPKRSGRGRSDIGGSNPVRRPDDKRKRLGPHSHIIDRGAVGDKIDASSREGLFLRAYERMLTEHVGGHPTVTQKIVIARACRIALHLELLDEQVFCTGKALTQHDYQHYCAWSRTLTQICDRLGLKPADIQNGPSNPTLDDYWAGPKR